MSRASGKQPARAGTWSTAHIHSQEVVDFRRGSPALGPCSPQPGHTSLGSPSPFLSWLGPTQLCQASILGSHSGFSRVFRETPAEKHSHQIVKLDTARCVPPARMAAGVHTGTRTPRGSPKPSSSQARRWHFGLDPGTGAGPAPLGCAAFSGEAGPVELLPASAVLQGEPAHFHVPWDSVFPGSREGTEQSLACRISFLGLHFGNHPLLMGGSPAAFVPIRPSWEAGLPGCMPILAEPSRGLPAGPWEGLSTAPGSSWRVYAGCICP